ncbi:hypothetical protein PMSD_01885 [Paenibacillus macquariensis subsp. defensor]|nr:hypothetical protein PMSD_01885 [Paenibacillus macquariensis subsp. defensor]
MLTPAKFIPTLPGEANPTSCIALGSGLAGVLKITPPDTLVEKNEEGDDGKEEVIEPGIINPFN